MVARLRSMKGQRKTHPNIFHVEVDKLREPGWKQGGVHESWFLFGFVD